MKNDFCGSKRSKKKCYFLYIIFKREMLYIYFPFNAKSVIIIE